MQFVISQIVRRDYFIVTSFLRFTSFCLPFVLLHSCGGSSTMVDGGSDSAGWVQGISLPMPMSNNALVSVEKEGGCMVFSMLGIDSSLQIPGILKKAFRWRQVDSKWYEMPEIPGPGRLAANAVGLRGEPYVLGGYDVALDGKETSHRSLQRFNLKNGKWVSMADLPIPIDDAGVVVWKDQYIIVVSGWSNTKNVSSVQIYDVETDVWVQGAPFPGTPVFGSAAALAGDNLIFIDGVKSSSKGFELVNQAWSGKLSNTSPPTITWTSLGEHAGPARYRAAPVSQGESAWFHGGTSEPYNFDGMRYDNAKPATPLATTLEYKGGQFVIGDVIDKPAATMDHRAMVQCGKRLMSIGGMTQGPKASAEVWSILP